MPPPSKKLFSFVLLIPLSFFIIINFFNLGYSSCCLYLAYGRIIAGNDWIESLDFNERQMCYCLNFSSKIQPYGYLTKKYTFIS